MTPLERRLTDENDRLRTTVAQLRRASVRPTACPLGWRLTPTEDRITSALLARDVVTHDALHILIPDHGEPRSQGFFRVMIHKIRRKLGVRIQGIATVGYSMDAADRTRLLAEMP